MKLLLLLVYHKFQSTLPTRGSDLVFCAKFQLDKLISIHAPHEGERLNPAAGWLRRHAISIHAPHEGERLYHGTHLILQSYFNPRSPRGGATHCEHVLATLLNISIHAPHEGERRVLGECDFSRRFISIHAPHEGERQYLLHYGIYISVDFNPRSPRGGATTA